MSGKPHEKRSAAIELINCVESRVDGVTVHGDIDGVHVVGGRKNTLENITKSGRGSAVIAEYSIEIAIKDVRQIGLDIDRNLEKALEEDIKSKNREGFFAKVYRFSKDIPAEKLESLIRIGEKIFS